MYHRDFYRSLIKNKTQTVVMNTVEDNDETILYKNLQGVWN